MRIFVGSLYLWVALLLTSRSYYHQKIMSIRLSSLYFSKVLQDAKTAIKKAPQKLICCKEHSRYEYEPVFVYNSAFCQNSTDSFSVIHPIWRMAAESIILETYSRITFQRGQVSLTLTLSNRSRRQIQENNIHSISDIGLLTFSGAVPTFETFRYQFSDFTNRSVSFISQVLTPCNRSDRGTSFFC